jgi:putative transposase
MLAEIGKRLGRKALAQVAQVAKPDTILTWYRRLIASKFDGSKHRSYPGRPRIGPEIEALGENGASELRLGVRSHRWCARQPGHHAADQTVGNILRRHGIEPAPRRSQNTTWREFIESHMAVLAGIDFFTVEVLTWRGLVTYYVLFSIHLESRRVSLAGITRHPDEAWMEQMARNATAESWGNLERRRYALHDRNTKFCASFRTTLAGGWNQAGPVGGSKSESERVCGEMGAFGKAAVLSKLILIGEVSLRQALGEFVEHFHAERKSPGQRQRFAVSV